MAELTEFQKGWVEGWHTAQAKITATLIAEHGEDGMKVAPEVMALAVPPPPLESKVEKMEVNRG